MPPRKSLTVASSIDPIAVVLAALDKIAIRSGPMSGAECDDILNRMEMTNAQFARAIGSVRTTVGHWRLGRAAIPPEIAEWLRRRVVAYDMLPPPPQTWTKLHVLEAAASYLRSIGYRAISREIADAVEAQGIPLNPGNPVGNVGQALSRSPRFNNVQGQGYGLAEWGTGPGPRGRAPAPPEDVSGGAGKARRAVRTVA